MMKTEIAFCGVDCSDCGDYLDGKCPSCRMTKWEEGAVCMPVQCCGEKGIACCAFCPGFPCGDMKEFYEESESHRLAYQLMLDMRAEGG